MRIFFLGTDNLIRIISLGTVNTFNQYEQGVIDMNDMNFRIGNSYIKWGVAVIPPTMYLNILQDNACRVAQNALELLESEYYFANLIYQKMFLQEEFSNPSTGVRLYTYLKKPVAQFDSLENYCKFSRIIEKKFQQCFHVI